MYPRMDFKPESLQKSNETKFFYGYHSSMRRVICFPKIVDVGISAEHDK